MNMIMAFTVSAYGKKQALINFKRETGVPAFPHFCSNFTPK